MHHKTLFQDQFHFSFILHNCVFLWHNPEPIIWIFWSKIQIIFSYLFVPVTFITSNILIYSIVPLNAKAVLIISLSLFALALVQVLVFFLYSWRSLLSYIGLAMIFFSSHLILVLLFSSSCSACCYCDLNKGMLIFSSC